MLKKSVFHKLSAVLWGLVVCAIVSLAMYVSLGRLLSTHLELYQEQILEQLNQRVPFHIEARSLSGEWHSFTPELVLSDLRLSLPGEDGDTLELAGGRIGIDVLDTLSTRSLQVTSLELVSLALSGELTADGQIIFPGLTGRGGKVGKWLREFILNVEYITLRDHSLHLKLPGGEYRRFNFNLHLAREGSTRRVSGKLISNLGSEIEVVARGVGNPFRPEAFTGELYLDINSHNLGAVRDMLPTPPRVWVDGTLASQWWLSWNRGKPSLDMSLQVSDAVVRPGEGDWSLPLDEVALQASLLKRKNRWTAYASGVKARRAEAEVNIPRIQLDAWGESVRLRLTDLQLEPLNQFALALDSLPDSLSSVLGILLPAGEVPALQISVGNITAPTAEWNVTANFDHVEVQSWKGAPGVTAATGYLELSETGGYVVLDSQQFTMDFPTVYRQPLYYDDIYGTLNLVWDRDALVLDSGIITAQAVEGVARALFRLNIPFTSTEAGLEMDLMVGLANSHPIHRVKYVPYVLNTALLDWLTEAVGEGEVRQAGFVWRGSLRHDVAPLRTVQLFFNVANTALEYHPDWPAVSGVKGTILIDDTDVSVWADTARLLQSEVRGLSAEAWMGDDRQMRLAIDGKVYGSATDGLAVVNASPLGKLAHGSFAQWQASGDLDADLHLELNLADRSVAPLVDVSTRWRDVNLDIEPGSLPLRGVNGELNYSSSAGFSSEQLQGRLWQQALYADVSQQPLARSFGDLDFSNSVLRIDLKSQLETDKVHDWLDLKAVELARGSAAVQGLVEIRPGEGPYLQLDSDLVGVALDLPPPWAKEAGEAGRLEISLPLGSEQRLLDLNLDDELRLRLDISGGGMRGAALGVAAAPPAVVENSVRVSGRASLVDVAAIQSFLNRYLIAEPAVAAPEDQAVNKRSLEVSVIDLHADRVSIRGRELPDVQFSLDYRSSGWQVAARTGWAEGSYEQPASGRAALQIDYLELSGLNQLVESSTGAAEAAVQLHPMSVDIDQLDRGGALLGELHFALEPVGDVIHARGIHGVLAGMELRPEQPAHLAWDQGADTRLDANLFFTDLGGTLQQLGYEKFLETDSGRLDLSLAWPGPPQDFSLAKGSGTVLIDMERGRFLDTPVGATGALKVVNVLNLAGVVERLSLSHMFDSGIPFDTLDGELSLHQGTLEVAGIDVVGGLSRFSFNGVSDVASRSLDGELVATLPVANNLPWVAALAGGLPVAAGVFVVSKVFEKQMNRLSSGVYRIGGTWDEPVISFDRIFDDETREVIRQLVDPNNLVVDENSTPASPDPATDDPNTVFSDEHRAIRRSDEHSQP